MSKTSPKHAKTGICITSVKRRYCVGGLIHISANGQAIRVGAKA